MSEASPRVLDTHRIVTGLVADAVATLGERARAQVLAVAANMEQLAREWLAHGEALGTVQASFEQGVVDHFQQDVHDDHWDTSWPACPRHPNHPLWYDGDRDSWCCSRDGAALARLGELASLRPSLG
jgi:hypothetical protein